MDENAQQELKAVQGKDGVADSLFRCPRLTDGVMQSARLTGDRMRMNVVVLSVQRA
jgi:hypothetical protein